MASTRPPPVSADEYARSALRVAVCQLAEAAGYGSARASAADALADVTARYVVALGRSAKGYAEAAGRGAANVADVVSLVEVWEEGEREGERGPSHGCLTLDKPIHHQLMALDDAGVTVDDLKTYIEADVRVLVLNFGG